MPNDLTYEDIQRIKENANVSAPIATRDIPRSLFGVEYNPKLEGAHLTDDLDEILAQEQGLGEKLVNGGLNFLAGTANYAAQFGIGIAALSGAGARNLISEIKTGHKIENEFGREMSAMEIAIETPIWKYLRHLDEKVKEALPIYTSNRYEAMSPLRQMGNINYWARDFNQGLQFMIGMWAPAALLTIASDGATAPLVASVLGRIGMSSASLTSIAAASEVGAGAVIRRLATRGTMAYFMSSSEALQEAQQVGESIERKLMPYVNDGRINPDTGKPWVLADIDNIKGRKLEDSYKMNLRALMLSNFVEAGFVLGAGKKALPITMKGGKYVKKIPKTGIGRALNSRAGKITKDIVTGYASEGLWEENIQYSIQNVLEKYAEIEADTKHEFDLKDEMPDIFATMTNMGEKERRKNILLGGLLGGGMGARSAVKETNREQKSIKASLLNLQNAYDNIINFDIYKNNKGKEVKIEKINSDGYTTYKKTSVDADGKEVSVTISEDEALKLAEDHNQKYDNGPVIYKEKDTPIVDDNGNRIIDFGKARKYYNSMKYISSIENLIDIEASKDDANKRRIDVLYNHLLTQWMLAHFKAGISKELFAKIRWYDGFSEKDAADIGLGFIPQEGRQEYVQNLMAKAKKLKGIYDSIDTLLAPTSKRRAKRISESLEKNYGVKINPRDIDSKRRDMLFEVESEKLLLKDMLKEADTERRTALSDAKQNNERLNEINRLAYQLQYEQARIARKGGEISKRDLKRLEELSNSIIRAKKELNSTLDEEEKIKEDDSVVYYAKEDESIEAERQSLIYADIASALKTLEEEAQALRKKKWYEEDTKRSKTQNRLDNISDAMSAKRYKSYEDGRSRAVRFRNNVNNLYMVKSIAEVDELLDKDDYVGAMGKIMSDNLKVSSDVYDDIEAKANKAKENKNRLEELQARANVAVDMGGEVSEDDQREIDELQDENRKNPFDKIINAFDLFSPGKERYIGEVKTDSESSIRRQIAEEFLDDGNSLLWIAENNKAFIDQGNRIPKTLKTLENLKRIIEERKEKKDSSMSEKDMQSILDGIDSIVEKLNKLKEDILKRKHDIETKDQVILEEETEQAYNTIGVSQKRVGAVESEEVSVLDSDIYEAIKSLVPSLDDLIKENKLIGVEAVYQQLREMVKSGDEGAKKLLDIINKRRAEIESEIAKSDAFNSIANKLKNGKWGKEVSDFWDNPLFMMMRSVTILTSMWEVGEKESPMQTFLRDGRIAELFRGLETYDAKNKESLIEISALLNNLNNLKTLYDNITNDNFSAYNEVKQEITAGESFSSKEKIDTFAPTNEQLISIRQMVKALTKWFDKTVPFEGFVLAEGFAGTGKSNVFSRWVKKIMRMSSDNMRAYGAKEESAKTIRDSLFNDKNQPSRNTNELIDDLDKNNIPDNIRFLVIDEFGQLSEEDIYKIRDGILKANRSRKDPLRVILLGDPNQITSVPTFSPLHNFFNIGNGFENIARVKQLTILHRSEIPELNEVVDSFIDQSGDITDKPLILFSNSTNPQEGTDPLYGIDGLSNPQQRILSILKNRVGKDQRTRAVIVSENLMDEYKALLGDLLDDKNLNLYTYQDAQSITVDEAYVHIDKQYARNSVRNGTESMKNNAYNTAMYTALSRARYYSFVGGIAVETHENPNIKPDAKEDTKAKENYDKFLKERAEDQKLLEKALGMEEQSRDEEDDAKDDISNEEDDEELDETNDSGDEEDIASIDDIDSDDIGASSTEEDDEVSGEIVGLKDYMKDVSSVEAKLNHVWSGIFKPLRDMFKPIQNGNKVSAILSSYIDNNGEKKRRILVLQKERVHGKDYYREVAVISPNEEVEGEYQPLYEKFRGLLNKPVDGTEQEFTKSGYNRIYRAESIDDSNILAEGIVSSARKRKFLYDKKQSKVTNYKTRVLRNLFDTQYSKKVYGSIWGDRYEQIRKDTISEWKRISYWHVYGRKSQEETPNQDIKRGWPYLIIPDTPIVGITNMENPDRQLTPLYIRMSWRKLNHDDDILNPIKEFTDVIEQLQNIVSKDNKHFVYGEAIFNRFVRDLALGRIDKDYREIENSEKILNDLARQFGIEKKNIPEIATFREFYRVKYGKEMPDSPEITALAKKAYDLVYVYDEKTDNSRPYGPAQKSLDKIAKANIFSNTVILRNIKKTGFGKSTSIKGRGLLDSSYGLSRDAIKAAQARINQKIEQLKNRDDAGHYKNYIELLEKQHDAMEANNKFFTLDTLKMAFDENMDLLFPVNAKEFNNTREKYVAGKYIQNTFVGVIPASVTVDWKSEVQEDEIEKDTPKAKPPKIGDFLKTPKKKGKKATGVEKTTKISERKARRIVNRIFKKLDQDELKFVDRERLINLSGNEKTVGLFLDGVMYLLKDIKGNVYKEIARHEAFHKIWNEYFTDKERESVLNELVKLDDKYKRQYGESLEAYEERLEESLATMYQAYKDGKSTFLGAIKEFFIKLGRLLGFINDNRTSIEKIFDAINSGYYGEKLHNANIERAASNINDFYIEGYSDYENYNNAKNLVSSLLNYYMYPDGELSYGDNEIINLPLSFSDAIRSVKELIDNTRKELREEYKKETEDLRAGRIESRSDDLLYRMKLSGILGVNRVFNNIVADLYPSVRFDDTENDLLDDIDAKVYNDLMDERVIAVKETELVSPVRKITQHVRTIFSNITYIDKDGTKNIVPFNIAYKILLDTFSQFTWGNDKIDTIANVENSVKSSGKFADLVISKIRGILENAALLENNDSVRGMGFLSSDTFVRSKDKKDIKYISPKDYSKKGVTVIKKGRYDNTTFFTAILKSLGMEINEDGYALISDLYKKHIAEQTLLEIQSAIGSLYRQRIFKGQKRYDSRGISYFYTEERRKDYKFNFVEDVKSKLYNAYLLSGKQHFIKLYDRIVAQDTTNEANVYALSKSILREYGYKNVKLENPLEVLNSIKFIANSVKNGENSEAVWDEIYNNNSGNISSIANSISGNLEESNVAFNYQRGDKKKAFYNILSNNAVDVLSNITLAIKSSKLSSLFSFLTGNEYFKYNIFNPAGVYSQNKRYTRAGQLPFINRIYGYINHDSIYSSADPEDVKRMDKESDKNYIERAFLHMFLDGVNKSKGTDIRYYQPISPIGERKRAMGVEVGVLNSQGLENAVYAAILQEALRPKAEGVYDVSNFGENNAKSYILGLTNTIRQERLESDEKYRKRAEAFARNNTKVVMNALSEKAEELFDSTVYKLVFQSDLGKRFKKLNDAGYDVGKLGGFKYKNIKDKKTKKLRDEESYKKEAKEALLKLFDLYYKNYYINGYFIDQLFVGDKAFYENIDELKKRIQIAFADGYKPLVGWFGMRKTFKVAVAEDLSGYFTGERWKEFKEIYGSKFEKTDGASFITNKRFYDISRKGFPELLDLGDILKPVYFGKSKEGIPVALKYSSIRLSDELIKEFPELKKLSDDMDAKGVDEYVFQSSIKIGSPNTISKSTDGSLAPINENSIITLENNNYRIQLNAHKDVDTSNKLSNPVAHLINADGKNPEQARIIYENWGKLIRSRFIRTAGKFGLRRNDIHMPIDTVRRDKDGNELKKSDRLRRVLTNAIKNISGMDRIYNLLTSKSNGEDYDVSINMPIIANKLSVQFISHFKNNALQVRFPGSLLILHPETGISKKTAREFKGKKKLEIRTDKGYAECYLPDIFKGAIEEGDLVHGRKGEKIFGFRIPTTGKHSMLALKVVGFYPATQQNIIIVPSEFTFTSGTDYDIDELFVFRKNIADKDYHVYDPLTGAAQDVLVRSGMEIPSNIHRSLEDLINAFRAMHNNDKAYMNALHEMEDIYEMSLINEMVDAFVDAASSSINNESAMSPIFFSRIQYKGNSEKLKNDVLTKMLEAKRVAGTSEQQITGDFNLLENQAKQQMIAQMVKTLKGAFINIERGISYIYQSTVDHINPFKNTSVKTFVYRGSLDEEDFNNKEQREDRSKYFKGHYFTTEKETAEGYAGNTGIVKKYVINVNKLLELRNKNGDYIKINKRKVAHKELLNKVNEQLGDKVEGFKRYKNLYTYLKEAEKEGVNIESILKELGYEGIVYSVKPGAIRSKYNNKPIITKKGDREYVVFDAKDENGNDKILDAEEVTKGSKDTLVKRQYHIKINNFLYDRLHKVETDANGERNTLVNEVDGEEIFHKFSVLDNIELFVNMAIDNLKLGYFPKFNVNSSTSDYFAGLISLGIPLDTVLTIMNSKFIVENMKEGKFDLDKTRRLILDSLINTEKVSLEDRNSEDYIPSFNITDYDLGKSVDDMSVEEKINAVHILDALERVGGKDFTSRNNLHESIINASVIANLPADIPSFYEDIVKLMKKIDSVFTIDDSAAKNELRKKRGERTQDKFVPIKGKENQYELKKSFAFENVQLFTLPHIKEAFNVLKFVKSKVENIWYKHNKDLTAFSESVYSWVSKNSKGFRSNNKESKIQSINEEFIKYILSGVNYPDGYTYDTYGDEYTRNGVTYYGATAWNQRFTDKVKDLKNRFYDNAFLNKLIVEPDNKGRNSIIVPYATQMNPIEIAGMQGVFEGLMEELKDENGEWQDGYENIDRDFMKYALLNWGVGVGSMNYTLFLPPALFSEATKTLDNFLYEKYTQNKERQDAYFENVEKHFGLQLVMNNGISVVSDYTYNSNYIAEKDDSNRTDKVGNKSIVYTRKYTLDEKMTYDSFPTFLRSRNSIYYKMRDVSDKFVYYSYVGNIGRNKNYRYSEDVAMSGYNPDIIYSGDYKVFSYKGNLTDNIEITVKTGSDNYKAGDLIIVRQGSDVTGIDARYYEVLENENGKLSLEMRDKVFTDFGINEDLMNSVDALGSANLIIKKLKKKGTKISVSKDVSDMFKDPDFANKIYDAMGMDTIDNSDITYTDDDGKPCAKMGLTNTVRGTGWKIVKDFKGKPKHSQGGVDITISDKGVSMRRGGKDIKAAHGLLIPATIMAQDGLVVNDGKPPFDEWYKTVPKEKNDTINYNLRRAYELAPKEQLDAFIKDPKAHLYSVYKNEKTGEYEFMKSKHHPTLQLELDWYYSKDGKEFRNKYDLDTSGEYYKYIPKKQ